MRIERLELRLLKLPLVHFFETSFGRIYDKHFIVVRLDGSGVSGFGECVADRDPYYSAETNETAWHIIAAFIAPRLLGVELALDLAARSSSEFWMPIDTPDAMRSRVPPRTRDSGSPRWRARRPRERR